jgi:hypothetical protein
MLRKYYKYVVGQQNKRTPSVAGVGNRRCPENMRRKIVDGYIILIDRLMKLLRS